VLWKEIGSLEGLARPCKSWTSSPATPGRATVVDTVSSDEHPILRVDFYNSLCAAFTLDEVRRQIAAAGLELDVARASDRHMIVRGLLQS
jgi:hypothetical protein